MIAFCMLILNLRLKPYADSMLNMVNQIAQVNLVRQLTTRQRAHAREDGGGAARRPALPMRGGTRPKRSAGIDQNAI
jgi:hypothetical protein